MVREKADVYNYDGIYRLVDVKYFVTSGIRGWSGFLSADSKKDELEVLRLHGRTGRPLGTESFVRKLERELSRVLRPRKPGPRRKEKR